MKAQELTNANVRPPAASSDMGVIKGPICGRRLLPQSSLNKLFDRYCHNVHRTFRLIPPLSWSLSLLAFAGISNTSAGQQQMRIIGSNTSVFPTAGSGAPYNNDLFPRLFVFTPHDDSGQLSLSPPELEEDNSYQIATFVSTPGFLEDIVAQPLASGGCGETYASPVVNSTCQPVIPCFAVAVGSGSDWLIAQPASSSVDSVLASAIGSFQATPQSITPGPSEETLSPSDLQITMNVQGGEGDGKTITLNAAMASGTAAIGTDSDGTVIVAEGDLILAVDWGTDPFGNRQYILLIVDITVEVQTADPCEPTGAQMCQQYLGASDALKYVQDYINGLANDLGSGSAYLQGAIPELLYLYDFSASATAPVLSTVPPNAITPDNDLYPDFAQYVNQYDAGNMFPLPPDSHGVPGGAACGPTCLTMALNSSGVSMTSIAIPYVNTMVGTVMSADKALSWLNGNPYPSQNSTLAPSPVPYTPNSYELYHDPNTGPSISKCWSYVDDLLSAVGQPIVFRTDLSGTAAPNQGFGHFVLLLGKGHSDNVAQLYGTSGDYYIVADPAGHYYADQQSKQHYNTVDKLRLEWEGINYGGWFAMYPVEMFQQRIFDLANGYDRITALTIGAPFYPNETIAVFCPVIMTVSDPFGDQTGILTNGHILSGIPEASFIPDVEDSEDGFGIDTNGSLTLLIGDPVAGTYQIALTGTNTGPFTLIASQIAASGTQLTSTNFSGNASPGDLFNCSFTAVPTGPPPLHFVKQAGLLLLSWPTNYVGYALQTTTNLAVDNSWSPAIETNTVEGGLNSVGVTMARNNQFFRLKH